MRTLEAVHAMCSTDLFKIAIEWYIKSYFRDVQYSVLCVDKVVTRKMRRVLNTLQQSSKSPASHMNGGNVKYSCPGTHHEGILQYWKYSSTHS
jgi:hypothetical protein